MKKLTFLTAILLALPMIGFGQNVNIPDANFKQCLVYHWPAIDTNGDNEIQVSEASAFNGGIVCGSNISNLTGIEAFTALTELDCSGNQLTSVDVSQNTALFYLNFSYNQLTTLDVSQNTALIQLGCSYNQLTTLDLSQNIFLDELGCSYNQLTTLDLSQNIILDELGCRGNQLTSLDLSQNYELEGLDCRSNQLTSLDVRNGNNSNFNNFDEFYASGNPNLTCINVDNVTFSTVFWDVTGGHIDPQHYFSNNCSGAGISDINESNTLILYPNPTNGDFTITGLELVGYVSSLSITDMNGKVVKVLDTKATKFSMASIKPGVYFLNILSGNKQEVLKIVKE
jgi:hypothetical protein